MLNSVIQAELLRLTSGIVTVVNDGIYSHLYFRVGTSPKSQGTGWRFGRLNQSAAYPLRFFRGRWNDSPGVAFDIYPSSRVVNWLRQQPDNAYRPEVDPCLLPIFGVNPVKPGRRTPYRTFAGQPYQYNQLECYPLIVELVEKIETLSAATDPLERQWIDQIRISITNHPRWGHEWEPLAIYHDWLIDQGSPDLAQAVQVFMRY